jgi:hypothetical protein
VVMFDHPFGFDCCFPQDFLLTFGNLFPMVFESTPDLLSVDALALALVSVSVLELCFRGYFR